MLVAIAVSLAAVGTVLGAYAMLSREMAVNYLGTQPAAATLVLAGGVDAATLKLAREHLAIGVAEAREVAHARVDVNGSWRDLLLFVVDDFSTMSLNTFTSLSGDWPPRTGSMLIERTAASMLDADVGGQVLVKTAHGVVRPVPIVGRVHDPGLAPAWQQRMGFGYITRDTYVALGESRLLHELRITLRDREANRQVKAIEAVASDLARQLVAQGNMVEEIRVPPPSQHPHQKQMTVVMFMMLLFSFLALILSGVLVATTLAAMLARQVREIGVMKTLGAQPKQIGGVYVVLVAGLGSAAFIVALPMGILGAQVFASAVSTLLNLSLTSTAIPHWVYLVQMVAGVGVPLIVAAVPIRRASLATVREAMNQYGVLSDTMRPWFSVLPAVFRNILRRPARLVLTLALLATGGAMYMTALNVSRSWQINIEKVNESRFYDVELRFYQPQSVAIVERLRQIPGVLQVEAWGYSPTAFARPGQFDVVRTYPDTGHGSLSVYAPSPETQMVRFPLKVGRWLQAGDTNAVVLGHAALAQIPQTRVGDSISLSLGKKPSTWEVVGIVEDIGGGGSLFVADTALARVMGNDGMARMVRVATDVDTPQQRLALIRVLEQALIDAGVGVETAMPFSELRTAVGDHVIVLVRALAAMAVVMAVVGVLGLGATMSTSVIERSREFGVMKTLGATPTVIKNKLVGEALLIGALSCILAFLLSVPITVAVDVLIGNLGFLAPLPLAVSCSAALQWFVLVIVAAYVATLAPVRQVTARSIRQALDCVG